MLTLTIEETEIFNDKTNEFFTLPAKTIQLEHSLVSMSKWEAKWHKPFLSKEEKTNEETMHYIKCMTITQNVPDEFYNRLTRSDIEKVNAYIDDPMTATWFADKNKGKDPRTGKPITTELVYYWMVALQIPLECQKWHFNRLLTLIRVCNEENNPKKMGKKEQAMYNREMNNARKAKLGTTG